MPSIVDLDQQAAPVPADGESPRCPVHTEQVLTAGWQGLECELCERAQAVAQGCRCGGSSVCPECADAAARSGDKTAKCSPDCDSLCPVCCPDS